MRTIILATLLVSALALAGCSTNTDSSTGAPTTSEVHEGSATVDMVGMEFAPEELRLHPGTTVTFRNLDDVGHTVTPDDTAQWGTSGSGDAPDQWVQKDGTWTHTFSAPGTYRCHCAPHATKAGAGYLGMVGTLIVE